MKLFIILNIFCFYLIQENQSLRACRDDQVNNVNITNLKYQTEAMVNETSSAIELFLDITWDISSNSADISSDGFIYRLLVTGGTQFQVTSEIAQNVCNPGSDYYWVNPNNNTCSNNSIQCDGPPMQPPEFLQLCPASFISEEEQTCMGTGNLYLRSYKYISVPLNIRRLRFKIEFHTAYRFQLNSYYKEFVGSIAGSNNKDLTIPSTNDCPATLTNSTMMSFREASQLCCDQNIPHFQARNFTFGEPIVNFDSERVNMSVSWLPPIDTEDFVRFSYFLVTDTFVPFPDTTAQPFKTSLNEQQRNSLSSCDNTSDLITAYIGNLIPGTDYTLHMQSRYREKETEDGIPVDYPGCIGSVCRTTAKLSVPRINVCDQKYNRCHKLATCQAKDETGKSSLKLTCICPENHEGNGLDPSLHYLGTGCKDIDFCTPEKNPCTLRETCVDRPGTEYGADCVCKSGFYRNGADCYSVSTVVLAVCIPVFVVFAIIIIFMMMKKYYQKCRWKKAIQNKSSSAVSFKSDSEMDKSKPKVNVYTTFP